MDSTTYPAFFDDLLVANNFSMGKNRDSDRDQMPQIDIRNWLPATQHSIFSLLQQIRTQTSSVLPVITALQQLSDLHAENGQGLEARLIRELCGLQAPVPYDDVHANCGYEFSSAARPSTFAKAIIAEHFVQDRVVVDVGCGNGRDAIGYAEGGAKRAVGIDSSPFIIERFSERLQGLDQALQSRITATCTDMRNLLTMHPDLAHSVDMVTWNSVLHLFPRRQLLEYLQRISKDLLTPEGMVGASVKTPASFFNTFGILLEEWETGNSRLCIDGQCRWFEKPDSFVQIIQTLFPKVLFRRVRTNQRADNSTDERIDVIAQK